MYYAFNVKPWDVAAGVLLIEEAGGAISTPDACAYSIFDRAIVATNDVLHKQVCVCLSNNLCVKSSVQANSLHVDPCLTDHPSLNFSLYAPGASSDRATHREAEGDRPAPRTVVCTAR